MPIIDKIVLKSVRNLPLLEIALDSNERKHLILTGPNGSGKTTVVEEIKKYLERLVSEVGSQYEYEKKEAKVDLYEDIFKTSRAETFKKTILRREQNVNDESNVAVSLTEKETLYPMYLTGDFFICLFNALRSSNFVIPKGPAKIETNEKKDFGQFLIQLLVNLRTQRSFARDNGDKERVEKTDRWFQAFEKALEKLLGHSDFNLDFDYNNFTYSIKEKDKEPYQFTELSDGYSALLFIVSELMLRMSIEPVDSYNKQGIVLIDEIENHLHVELQKKVLPFLIEFFPNIQFIVTTHSPFVLSSIKNSVIYDLEHRKQYSDFSEYSYTGIVENYFQTQKYSDAIIAEVEQIEKILQKETLDQDEKLRVKALYDKINAGSGLLELQVKFDSLITPNYSKLHGVF